MGYKSLAQTPARRNRPVSLYVRPHPNASRSMPQSYGKCTLAVKSNSSSIPQRHTFCNRVATSNFAAAKALGSLHSSQPGRGLTGRSTGPIAAGRHLGYKSLAQIPACRNGPFTFDVRHHPENVANFINSARRDASPHKNSPQFELLVKHIHIQASPARRCLFHQTVLSHCIHIIRSAA